MIAFATLINCSELLLERKLFLAGNLFSWPGERLASTFLYPALSLLRYPAVIGLLALRLVVSLVLLVQAATAHARLASLVLLTLLAFVFQLRDSSERNGADRILLVFLTACTLAEAVHTSIAMALALSFIAAQSALVYGSSGLLKLRHASWRDGSALLYVLSTSSCGNARLYRFLGARRRLAAFCGQLVAAECVLAVAGFLPPTLCLIVLGCGLLMHVLIARVLGLNLFLFAFTAAYPATFFVACSFHSFLTRGTFSI